MEGRNVDEQLVGDGVRDYAHPASVAGLEQGSKSHRKIFRSQPSAGIDEGAVDPDGVVAVIEAGPFFFLQLFTRGRGSVFFLSFFCSLKKLLKSRARAREILN